MPPNPNINPRDESLTHAIVELIAIHQGMNYNKIIKKLKDEGFSSHSVIGKKLKELEDIEIIEYLTGSDNKHRYYIHGITKSEIKYDKKLSNLLSNLKKIIEEIEEDSPEYNQDIRNHLYQSLENVESSLQIPNYLREQPIPPEDGMIEEIYTYSIYDNDEIQNKINDAKKTHNQIQELKIRKSNTVQKIIKTKDDVKKGSLCMIVIESSKDIRDSLNHMFELLNILKPLKDSHQRKIFCQVFDSLNTAIPKPTKNYRILKELETIQRNTTDVNAQQKLNEIVNHLYKEIQKPVKKNVLIKKLIDTGQFSKDDAYEILHVMSNIIDGVVSVNKNDVSSVHPGYPLSYS